MSDLSSFRQFCSSLHARLLSPLPGYDAQKLMEPPSRQQLLLMPRTETPREGAVLIVLFPDGMDISTVMIQRAVYDGVHSGQIAFPGGRRDHNDKTLLETALREAEEEVGIVADSVKVLGTLSSLYIPPSNFNVLPVVACLDYSPELKIQPDEVSEAFFISLTELAKTGNCRPGTINLTSYSISNVPTYCVNDRIIWGATAMIISELIKVIPPLST